MVGPALALLSSAFVGSGACYASNSDIARGEVVTVSNVAEVACDAEKARGVLGFDPDSRAPIAIDALPAGTYLGRILPLARAHVAKGQKLTLQSRSGPVFIEREVVAMQSAVAGEGVFVRESGGKVFAVRIGKLDQ